MPYRCITFRVANSLENSASIRLLSSEYRRAVYKLLNCSSNYRYGLLESGGSFNNFNSKFDSHKPSDILACFEKNNLGGWFTAASLLVRWGSS